MYPGIFFWSSHSWVIWGLLHKLSLYKGRLQCFLTLPTPNPSHETKDQKENATKSFQKTIQDNHP